MISNRPAGMRAFTLLWVGQIVSVLGSAMTWFAFTIWAWKLTGSVLSLAIISFAAYLPPALLSPLAGIFVDRWDRKLVLIFSDAGTAAGTLAAFILYATNNLQIWHVYVIAILAGSFTAFQYPAYTAAMTTMLPKEQYSHANGMRGLSVALSGILAPVFAAALLNVIGMGGIMAIDLITYLVAFGTLLYINVPRPTISEVGAKSHGTIWQEIRFGFRYLRERPSLSGLTLLFMFAYAFLAVGTTLEAPKVLSETGNNASALAAVQAVGAIGGVVGGVVMSLWGGPRRRIHSVLLGGMGSCLLGVAWLGWSRTIVFLAIGSFFFAFFEPFVEGSNLSIWQSKVEADIQGRVLSARQLLVQLPFLGGILLAGYITKASTISGILIFAGIAGTLVFLLGYFFTRIRDAETLLRDTTESP